MREKLPLRSLDDVEVEVGFDGAQTRPRVVQLKELSGALLARGVVDDELCSSSTMGMSGNGGVSICICSSRILELGW